MEMEAFVTSAG